MDTAPPPCPDHWRTGRSDQDGAERAWEKTRLRSQPEALPTELAVRQPTELPDPVPAAGEVLIAVRAFGLNHAEGYMRSRAFGEVAKITGIECAGTVVADRAEAAGTTPRSATAGSSGTSPMPPIGITRLI